MHNLPSYKWKLNLLLVNKCIFLTEYLKLRAKIQAKGDLKEEAEIVNVLGELHTEIEDHEEALNLHKEELGLCQATEDSIGQAVAHRKVGH